MPFSESTLNELRAELVGLHQVQVQLAERIKAIEAILAPLDFSQIALPLQLTLKASGSVTPTADDTPPVPLFKTRPTGTGGKLGLRDAVLFTLRQRGPMRAPQIAKVLQTTGVTGNDSKTPLATRIYNDLWRLAEQGVYVTRAPDGAFQLKEGAQLP